MLGLRLESPQHWPFCFFGERVSLCILGCPGTSEVAKITSELMEIDLFPSSSQVLDLKACVTMPNRCFHLLVLHLPKILLGKLILFLMQFSLCLYSLYLSFHSFVSYVPRILYVPLSLFIFSVVE